MDDVFKKYPDAKAELQLIGLNDFFISYDDSMRRMNIEYGIPEDNYRLDIGQLKVRIFIVSFFFVTMIIAGWANGLLHDMKFSIYAGLIALFLTFISTITKKTKILIDFEKQTILRNSRKQKFADIEGAFLDEYSVYSVILQIVTLKTRQGKMNFPLFSVTGQSENAVEELVGWSNKYLRVF